MMFLHIRAQSEKRIMLEELIESDLFRYGFTVENKPSIIAKSALYGYNYSSCMRKVKYYKENGNLLLFALYRVKLRYLMFKYGFQIPYKTQIGKGFYIGHFGTVIVNFEAIIGNNVNLSPGVTIGGANRGKNKGAPIIGDKVWVGSNAVIVGKVHIGNDVMIAPNAFVNVDIPEHSIAIGNPVIIHRKENATASYIENVVEV